MKKIIVIFWISIFLSCSESKESKVNKLEAIAEQEYANANFQSAMKSYNQLIQLDSMNGHYWFRRGNLNAFLHNYAASNQDYFKSIGLDYRVVDAFYNLGLNFSYEDDSTALFYLKEAFNLAPNDSLIVQEIESCMERLNQ